MAATTITFPAMTDSTSGITGDFVNAAFFTAIQNVINTIWNSINPVQFEKAVSGSTYQLVLNNSSNTASSDSEMLVQVGGTSAGDPYIGLNISGATTYTLGLDNSDGDSFKVSTGAVGTGTVFKLTPTRAYLNGGTSTVFCLVNAVANASLPAAGAGESGQLTIDTTNNRLIYYSNANRYFIPIGTSF